MRKIFYPVWAALSVLALASCEKETATDNPNQQPENLIEWSFTAGTPETKTVMGEPGGDKKAQVSWEDGDVIDIWYLDAGNAPKKVTGTSQSAGASTTFKAQIPAGDNPDHFWAAYPAGTGTLTYEESTEKFTISVSSDRFDGSFKKANIMAAYSTAVAKSFAFKHAVGIFKIALPTDGIITHGGVNHTITTLRIKGKETSIHSMGTVEVNQDAGVVSGFAESTGTSSAPLTLSDEVRSAGIAYIPSFPGTLANGFAVRYYSEEGSIPAVVTGDTSYSLERGHILPIADASPYIVWDYYVSADGDGNGKAAGTPMSLESLQTMLSSAGQYMFNANLLTGTTIHFAAGAYNLTASLVIPNFSEMAVVKFEGNGAILNGGETCRVLEINGRYKNLSFKDFTIQNGLHASKGGGIYIAPGKDAADNTVILDFTNCLIKGNKVTSGNGGALAIDAHANGTPGGQVRFNNCRFQDNAVTTGQAGAVYIYPNCGVAAMFNKCTFIGNTGTSNTMTIGVNCNSTKDKYLGRLGMNNCTVNAGNKTFSSNGSALTLKGYSVVANSTVWNSGELGKWGHIALGANKAAQELDADAARIVNCLVRNNSSTYKALYLHGSYYQNIAYCLYTGLTEAGSATATGETPTYTVTNSLSIDRAITGASAKNTTIEGVQAYYYTFTADYSGDMTFPTLEQVRSSIEGTTNIGPLFLAWLDTIEGSLTTDITGYDRDADASHPGSWQKR